jgi:hypothetical protein
LLPGQVEASLEAGPLLVDGDDGLLDEGEDEPGVISED